MTSTRLAYPQRKADAVQRVKSLAGRFSVIAVTKLHKVRASQLMEVRRKLRDRMGVYVAKNKIVALALREAGVGTAEALLPYLEGQNALVFTDLDPFELSLLLDKEKVYLPARPGDVATEDITVPAGNTGIAPGPVLSEFKEAGVPTRIDAGSIWVAKDSVVAKKGGTITPKLASLLGRLGVKPIAARLSIAAASWSGRVIAGDVLRIDLQSYKASLAEAQASVFKLALASSYPHPSILPLVLAKASREAEAVARAAQYETK